MTEYAKLLAARLQLENIVNLTKDNPHKDYLYRYLVLLHVEIERQLANMAPEDKTVLTDKDKDFRITP